MPDTSLKGADAAVSVAVVVAVLVTCLAVAGFAGWVAQASLQQDFAAYWVAGAARRAGLDPYVNHVGSAVAPALWDGVAVFAHSRFLYPPIVAELFRAFAVLPFAVAKTVFSALMAAAWLGACLLTARAVPTRAALGVAFGAGALSYPLALALERGQVDPLVLLLLVVAFAGLARPAVGGAALAGAVAFKPALAGVLIVFAALHRWRAASAALFGIALLALASVAVSGPRLARTYATEVLPRAALFGEGGDASMLLPPERLAEHADDLEAGVARLGGRAYPVAAWDGPASASLPRLLAPEAPSRLAARAPAVVLLGALVAAALAARRRARSAARDALLSWATAVACVIASPAGWVMGLVLALPLVPWLVCLRDLEGTAVIWRGALALGLLAVACPPPVAGWAALAGALVVASAAGLALALPAEAT
jgi:Glycosyltransferase family 87